MTAEMLLLCAEEQAVGKGHLFASPGTGSQFFIVLSWLNSHCKLSSPSLGSQKVKLKAGIVLLGEGIFSVCLLHTSWMRQKTMCSSLGANSTEDFLVQLRP